ncbi:MAG: hypothetical protein ACFB9M_20845 [Myxococcota bacterium]
MSGGPEDYSAEQCIEAGTYWFGRSDLEAAEAWWRRALEIEPGNAKALECLRLVLRTTRTGFKQNSWSTSQPRNESPFTNPKAPELTSRPYLEPRPRNVDEPAVSGTSVDLGSLDLPDEPALPGPVEPDSPGPPVHTGSWPLMRNQGTGPIMRPLGGQTSGGRRAGSRPGLLSTDPLDFVSDGPDRADMDSDEPDPWATGPAVTVPMVVESDEAFDAVAEPTPLPELEVQGYFDRYPATQAEIEDYLRATGDLTPPQGEGPPASVEPEAQDPLQRARDLFSLHDFDGVVEELEALPANDRTEEARTLLAEARTQLIRMYESKVGDFERVPRVNVTEDEVIWLNLNHRAGFILSQIDGSVTFEDLVALSGMPRLDTVRILAELIQQRVIE